MRDLSIGHMVIKILPHSDQLGTWFLWQSETPFYYLTIVQVEDVYSVSVCMETIYILLAF